MTGNFYRSGTVALCHRCGIKVKPEETFRGKDGWSYHEECKKKVRWEKRRRNVSKKEMESRPRS